MTCTRILPVTLSVVGHSHRVDRVTRGVLAVGGHGSTVGQSSGGGDVGTGQVVLGHGGQVGIELLMTVVVVVVVGGGVDDVAASEQGVHVCTVVPFSLFLQPANNTSTISSM